MIASPARVSAAPSVMSAPPPLVELAFEHLAVARHEKAECKVDRRGEHISLDVEALPVRVGQRRVGGTEQIEKADDDDQRGVLESADKAVDQGRNNHCQRLRQNNQAGATPIPETERIGGLVLAPRDRLQTAADGFGKISG